ncbi:13226_t:CDS:2 [Funneliformis mosseae]|uniref:13226_t:CDS:1 n=1 Tax=Funneliformis mosseae TaxID=27381 RepID=A0A9N9BU58_FUNMO|nr:13226_t:CDS:2 [Funneliformis mosseae]
MANPFFYDQLLYCKIDTIINCLVKYNSLDILHFVLSVYEKQSFYLRKS